MCSGGSSILTNLKHDYKGRFTNKRDDVHVITIRLCQTRAVIGVYAHRGMHSIERENTLGAFRAAVALGVDGVELDVRRTLDGTLVVHHDPSIGDQIIVQSGRRTLPSYVPTFDEAMTALSGVRVNVEIKNSRGPSEPSYDETGDLARQVVASIRALGWQESVSISCFDLATCAVVRSVDRDITVGWLLWDVAPSDAMIRAHVLGFNAINPHFSTVDAQTVALARELELDVNVWTVNSREDLERMVSFGVASIITDDPALAQRVVSE
jgi:glycerophosphoryl diester phosphodiesterase